MTLTIDTKHLARIVETAAPAVPRHSDNPIYATIRLTGSGDKCTARATDRVIEIRSAGVATGELDICVSAVMLAKVVKTLPKGDVTISTDGIVATFTAGVTTFELPTTDVETWPKPMDFASTATVVIDGYVLAATLRNCAAAAAPNENRPVLHGAFFTSHAGKLRIVATDSYRLYVENTSVDAPDDLRSIVPLGAVQALAKQCSGERVTVATFDDLSACFDSNDTTLITSLLLGEYPPYERLIPDSFPHSIEVVRDDLIKAVRRVSIFATERFTGGNVPSTPVIIKIGNGALTLSVSESGTGEGATTVEARCEPIPDIPQICFNPRYLLDALATCGETVTIKMVGALKPAVIATLGDDSRFTLLMPVKVAS